MRSLWLIVCIYLISTVAFLHTGLSPSVNMALKSSQTANVYSNVGVIIVDHGSKKRESNELLVQVCVFSSNKTVLLI